MDNEHWDLGAILAGIEHLGRLEGTGIKSFDLDLPEDAGVKGHGCEVTVVDDAGSQEGGELVEDLFNHR